MISFNNRFHGHNSLRYVYKNGVAVRSHSLTIKTIANQHRRRSRIAVVIGKKILKSAVRRNLLRRRIYEYMRLKLPNVKGIFDIVIIITSSDLLAISHDELSEQIDLLLRQTDVLRHRID
jgi:ribonuclease P protein component